LVGADEGGKPAAEDGLADKPVGTFDEARGFGLDSRVNDDAGWGKGFELRDCKRFFKGLD
jgi:hypothetical protein